MTYEARCPSCGATVVFKLGASLLRICEHCGTAVVRKGADIAAYGRVADLLPTASVLALGLEGGYQGAPRFTLVGRLQLDYGAGTWDEWLMAFSDGTWSWLSESQGKLHYMGQMALPPVPAFDELQVGATVDLGPPGTFVVAEVRQARFMTAAGELPFDVEPGSLLNYADLSGPGGQFGTLDYGTRQAAEALYVGREVGLAEMGIRNLPAEEERRTKVEGRSLSCTQCGGPLEVRVPDQTQRVACPYCGSLLDATKDFAVLEALAHPPVKPRLALGSQGELSGTKWTIIGFMERSATVEGVRYPWHEYLLYEPRHGFRWLVESEGHWSFVETVNPGDVSATPGLVARYRGTVFKHFQSSPARVDHVLGEFYWAVARGDMTQTADYVSPPHMLSMEKSPEEITWSYGTYLDPQQVWQAFAASEKPPERRGVAMNQPWHRSETTRGVWSQALLAAGALLLLFLLLDIASARRVFTQEIQIPSTAVPGAPESATFAGPFELSGSGNLEVKIEAPVNDSWLYVDGALINEDTGGVDEFELEASYYSGSDEDGSWSEGSRTVSSYVGNVPAGRYTLRLAPQWEAGRAPSSYQVSVRRRVPRFYQAVLAFVALLAWPLTTGWGRMRFETQRWSQSDHAAISIRSGGGDDSDDD
jgi:hypothetical protein